jgi:hypothetical protein
MQKLEPSRQIHLQYSEADSFVVQPDCGKRPANWMTAKGTQRLDWTTVAYLDGRFRLTLVQPVTIDFSVRTVEIAGDPRFWLEGMAEIGVIGGDPASSMSDSRLTREFGKADWDKFVASDFDLTTLGISRTDIRPIPRWEEYVREWRSFRRPPSP